MMKEAVLTATAAAVLVIAPAAGARMVPVNGKWGAFTDQAVICDSTGTCGTTFEAASFNLRSKRVSSFGSSTVLHCTNPASGDYDVVFELRNVRAMQGAQIPGRDLLERSFTAQESTYPLGRRARVTVKINFRTARPSVTVTARTIPQAGSSEQCGASIRLDLKRLASS